MYIGKKLQQQITHDDKLIPRSRIRFERPDEDETAEYQTFLKSGVFKNITQPTYPLPAWLFASTMRNLTPCFGPCLVS